MSDGDGGVTLKLDADTSGYLAGMQRAVKGTHDLVEPLIKSHELMESLGDAARKVAQNVSGMHFDFPTSLPQAVESFVESQLAAWEHRQERIKEILEETIELQLRIAGQPIATTSAKAMEAMKEHAPALGDHQLGDLFSGATQSGGMTDASPEQLGELAKSGNRAWGAGVRDIGRFGQLYGRAHSIGMADPANAAFFAQRYLGEAADKALDVASRNPAAAEEVMQVGAAAVPGGKKTREFFGNLSDSYLAAGGTGSFTSFVRSRGPMIAGFGPEHAGEQASLAQILRRLDQQGLSPQGDGLGKAFAAGQDDPVIRAAYERDILRNKAKEPFEKTPVEIRRKVLSEQALANYREQHPVLSWGPLGFFDRWAAQDAAREYTGGQRDEGSPISATTEAMLKILKSIEENTDDAAEEAKRRSLNPGSRDGAEGNP